ncbi:uncharacterized protein BT62DRAFT_332456 [Guyanagaster necrorhizus]|uniref:Uncharacterized protein n=1 Tax=Guyanagaster necrorhizus TaxID=856835 RepID=A0A9P7VN10_9AGAR|nr:uncharacterized protein BT62DRAFT_332456 [Guyanagaster necrorhizus MCA 3950]KAG7443457.1 hypothetical protein BT62DRAFT_332456 [Guyanagaster necrorhizus MCA 3950]
MSSPTSTFAEDDDTAAYIEDCQLLLFEVSISAEDNSRYGEAVVYAHYASHLLHAIVKFHSSVIISSQNICKFFGFNSDGIFSRFKRSFSRR